jgi:hypothetical protein
MWRFGALARHHARLGYWAGVCAIVLAIAAIVALGLWRGSLPSDSLAFRWRYWTGSWRMIAEHPWLGVGWANFGEYYLRFRLPSAVEEIKDPHNLFVKMWAELGIIGLALLIAWLGRLWWELTRPIEPPPPAAGKPPHIRAIGFFTAAGCSAMLLNILASVDLAQDPFWIAGELMRRGIYLCLFLVAAVAATVRSQQEPRIDERPAPWLLCGTLVAIGLFLLHNLVDFSLFDPNPGALLPMALFGGSALGARQREPQAESRARTGAFIAAASALGLYIVVLGAFIIPLVLAEWHRQSGDHELRLGRLPAAAAEYADASAKLPISNGDYLYRRMQAMAYARAPRELVRDAIGRAIAADPGNVAYRLFRARLLAGALPLDADAAVADYDAAVAMDPNNIPARLEYARLLAKLNRVADARRQFELSLWYNRQLPPDEPRRLPPPTVEQINKALQQLRPTSAP